MKMSLPRKGYMKKEENIWKDIKREIQEKIKREKKERGIRTFKRRSKKILLLQK